VPGDILYYRRLFLGGKHESPYTTTPCENTQVSHSPSFALSHII
jgi:hypothetical protein